MPKDQEVLEQRRAPICPRCHLRDNEPSKKRPSIPDREVRHCNQCDWDFELS